MDKLVGQINGKFSTPNWSPIRYIYGCISQSELAGLQLFRENVTYLHFHVIFLPRILP